VIPQITCLMNLTTGQLLEVVLAKPQADKKPDGSYPYNAGVNPNPVPLPAYSGFAGNPYGSLGTGFGVAAGFQQVSWSF
jgi:heterogeneous nuclear ribonucleoprotein R